MGELLFAGLGLRDERDLSLRATEELRRCDRVFLEEYTSRSSPGTAARLAELLSRPVETLGRAALEAERVVLEPLSRGERVGLVVVGEPFAATTHLSLRLSAERAGHTWRVLHNASILTAAPSLAGLSLYKFGRVVSLPAPHEGYEPRSPYDGIAANRAAGLHTLVLLDLDVEVGRYLEAGEALRVLASLELRYRSGVLLPGTEVVALARVGSESPEILAGPWEIVAATPLGPALHTLLLPQPPLHFLEEEALSRWRRRLLGSAPPGTRGTANPSAARP